MVRRVKRWGNPLGIPNLVFPQVTTTRIPELFHRNSDGYSAGCIGNSTYVPKTVALLVLRAMLRSMDEISSACLFLNIATSPVSLLSAAINPNLRLRIATTSRCQSRGRDVFVSHSQSRDTCLCMLRHTRNSSGVGHLIIRLRDRHQTPLSSLQGHHKLKIEHSYICLASLENTALDCTLRTRVFPRNIGARQRRNM